MHSNHNHKQRRAQSAIVNMNGYGAAPGTPSSASHTSALKRTAASERGNTKTRRMMVFGLIAVVFIVLNALPWFIRDRNRHLHDRLQDHHDALQGGKKGSNSPAGTVVAKPVVADANNDGDVEANQQQQQQQAQLPNGRGGDVEVDEPSSAPTATTEEAEELLDSLTAAQLIDGGYSYRSYAEVEDEIEGPSAAAHGKDTDKEPQADGKSSKKKGSGGMSRSFGTHEFSTAKPYQAIRPSGRVCEPLAPNVSLAALKKDPSRIGTYQEFWYTGDIEITPEEALGSEAKAAEVMAMRTRRPTAAQLRSGRGGNGRAETEEDDGDGDDDTNDDGSPTEKALQPKSKEAVVKYAYVLMISNHKYVDGALVVAQSLRQHSEMVKSGEADLVLIISEKIKMTSVRLLSRVFTRVKIMYSMAAFAPLSYYKTTFDKIYLFWLTEYKVVLFMDADSLVTGNPDGLIRDKEFEGDAEYAAKRYRRNKNLAPTPLTAVGGGDYFQTGLLIAKPNRQLFTDLFLEFRLGAFGYNQWRARDGVLIRTCFMQHHTNIEHPIDRLYHFYGFVKPWFNKDTIYKYSKGDEKLSFNPNYWDWWRRYEELHNRYFVTIAAVEQQREDKLSAKTDTFAQYVYGNSANYPDKEVPIPGLALKHPYSGAKVEARKAKGGWSKFDALKVNKRDFPTFFNNCSINEKERLVMGGGGRGDDVDASDALIAKADSAQLVTSIVKPTDYMWIQRFSVGAEYFRPTYRKYAEIFNYSVEAVGRRFLLGEKLIAGDELQKGNAKRFSTVLVGSPGDSCSEACEKAKGQTFESSSASVVTHGRCVEEALKATTVNDCFYGHTQSFAPRNKTVVMGSCGRRCDVCVYEYKSDAAPFIFPATREAVKAYNGGSEAVEGKHNKKKRAHKKHRGAKKKDAAGEGSGEDAPRGHRQEILEADEDEDSIRRRFELAGSESGGEGGLNECRVNFLHEKLLHPTCGARRPGAARVCVCV